MTGVADNMHPDADAGFRRAHEARPAGAARRRQRHRASTSLDEAMSLILSQPTGRINVRGANGSGKSTLLTSLKSAVKTRAYYWPTADRLAFAVRARPGRGRDRRGRRSAAARRRKKAGLFVRRAAVARAAGDRRHTDAPIYLLDEWDANLDPEQPRRRRRAGRGTGPARPGGRDFAPRPGVARSVEFHRLIGKIDGDGDAAFVEPPLLHRVGAQPRLVQRVFLGRWRRPPRTSWRAARTCRPPGHRSLADTAGPPQT